MRRCVAKAHRIHIVLVRLRGEYTTPHFAVIDIDVLIAGAGDNLRAVRVEAK